MQAVGSIMTNKYSEGYPGARYYGGNEYVESPFNYLAFVLIICINQLAVYMLQNYTQIVFCFQQPYLNMMR